MEWTSFLFKRKAIHKLRLLIFLATAFLVLPGIQAQESCSDVFNGNSLFSHVKPPLVKNPQFASPPRIVTTHYSGTGSFDRSISVNWAKNQEGGFTTDRVKLMQLVGYRLDELVISQQQDFSMGTMVTTNYLTPEQASMFRNLGTNLEPGQVVFSEVIRDATPEEVRTNYGEDSLEHRRGGMHTERFREAHDTIPVKTAALWSVSGQIWGRSGRSSRPVQLPWEKEEARQGQALDRSKYKYVFEWGRAAQEVSGEMAPLYSLNALQNYLHLRAYNGKLAEAFVMVHSFDPVNTRLYAKMTNNGHYPPDTPVNPKDALFITPLEWALTAHPPSRVSRRVADLVRLSEGTLTEINAVNLLIDNRVRRWSELDYAKNGVQQDGPIIMNDLSLSRAYSLSMLAESVPTKKSNQQEILDMLFRLDGELTLLSGNFEGKYKNATDVMTSSYLYKDRNAVEVMNLDVKMAIKDADYARSVIFAAYRYQIDRIADIFHRFYGLSVQDSLFKAQDLVHESGTRFGVSTHIPLIQHQLKKLSPSEQVEIPRHRSLSKVKPSALDLELNPDWYNHGSAFLFTADQIAIWGLNDRNFATQNQHNLSQGKWHTQYLLSLPDLF